MTEEILFLFHHIHHLKSKHEVHHCGDKHRNVNAKLNYVIRHCPCGKHSINRKQAIGHATTEESQPIEIKVKFTERCPQGGWHLESGEPAKLL